jgi:glycosyltransferase involved in cell wall biosynthesis
MHGPAGIVALPGTDVTEAAPAQRVLRIAWVTNVSAPYRRPVWAEVARHAHLRVGLLADNLPNRRWDAALPEGVARVPMRCKAPTVSGLPMYVLLRTGLEMRQLDAVVLPGWETPAAWQLLVLARLHRVSTIAFYESLAKSHRFSGGPVAFLRRRFFRAADCVLTVGEASTEAALGFGVPRDRVVTTYNAVDVRAINAAAAQAAHDEDKRRRRLIYVGQLIPRKNVDGLLRAFAALPDDTTLTIAGEGAEEARLQRLAVELGVAARVEFVGYVQHDDIAALLASAATLVMPSHREVYGLVVNEALAAGLHAVVSEHSGVLPDVRHMVGVFPTGTDVPSLTSAVAASLEAWNGPVQQPAILGRTPEVMAADVLRAAETARGRNRRRR